MTASTVTDITPRLAARVDVVPLQRELAEVIPLRRRHESVEEHTAAQIEKLLWAIVQADCYAAHPSASPSDQATRRTEVLAYAYAVGIALHPEDPAHAHAIKRTLMGHLTAGVTDVDELTGLLLDTPFEPEAC